MSVPFFLSLVLFVAALTDVWIGSNAFVTSAAYRAQPHIAAAVVGLGVLLWVWGLLAARRRATRIVGPVETVRGRPVALQPILATIFIVSGFHLIYDHTLPRVLNWFSADHVESETFTLAGDLKPSARGCERAAAVAPRFGEVLLCLPEGTERRSSAGSGDVVVVTGLASWFGIDPDRFEIAPAVAAREIELDAFEPPAVAPPLLLDKLSQR